MNAVVEFTWPGTVEELLVHCQGIERALGRIRSGIDVYKRQNNPELATLKLGGRMRKDD